MSPVADLADGGVADFEVDGFDAAAGEASQGDFQPQEDKAGDDDQKTGDEDDEAGTDGVLVGPLPGGEQGA